MPSHLTRTTIADVPALVLDSSGPLLRTEDDARDLIQETFGSGIRLVVVPVERFDPDFFVLRTGVAGEFVQKLVQYRLHLAVVGDLSAQISGSDALRDWVREANRGPDIWFVADVAELQNRLSAAGGVSRFDA